MNKKHEQMQMIFKTHGQKLGQAYLGTTGAGAAALEPLALAPVQLGVRPRTFGRYAALNDGYSSVTEGLVLHEIVDRADGFRLLYRHPEHHIAVTVAYEWVSGASAYRQNVSVTNEGSEPIALDHVSSLFVQGMGAEGIRDWNDPAKIRVHYCLQTWEGEGQWRSAGLEELGVFPVAVHPDFAAVHFSSVGTWSTGRFVPMIVIEDVECGQVWYGQIETSSHWHMEIGRRSLGGTSQAGSLYVQLDAASERHGGWWKSLAPGETFQAPTAAFGCAKGGFQEAIRELTRYRRTLLRELPTPGSAYPVIFNDYMNCLWGNPTEESLVPLIEAASRAGAEVFMIDAGWFGSRTANWGQGLGDWNPSGDRFGQEGLPGILGLIRAKGMLPGLWLEIEVCGEEAGLFSKPDDWFLLRGGRRIGASDRVYLDYRNPDVRAYVHGVIDRLAAMGVRYIKNDYNQCVSTGVDEPSGSEAAGLLDYVDAFYQFMDEVRERHPNVIWENCGSGAMRQDYGILQRFDVQSTSDQEIYWKYPAIVSGALATLAPEHAGVWAYPMPVLFPDREQADAALERDAARMQDGEQTVFNMVNGLLANLYMSGRIDRADERNFALVQEGIALFKELRGFIRQSSGIWPTGMMRIGDKQAFGSAGLWNEEQGRAVIAVWRLDSGDECLTLPLAFLRGREAQARQIYPSAAHADKQAGASLNESQGTLTVRLEGRFTARLFEVLV
ncbi:glycoside hydrolase family 36 protein [Paenibacillus sacheonensis]|uniref:Alpha-galactosidase n=1 Tax=Paenibacillus sacheonensis TaxID=742054 RepID=A0A7X4YU05_9BACL|nr:glycoside hydrolase family 36 protein [Paenibacillus sacheonensis]MBM7568864.1 alpha-galactosidase [Paenibacillus sacheonensis]NBC72567.1 hypothetical protein [Paenibacillus sacheonensis]